MNPLLDQVAPSIIRAINARKREGDIDLGIGEPTLRPDTESFRAATRWVEEHGCPYTSNAGFPELREHIAARYGAGRFTRADEVCVTVGSEEALYLAIKTVVDREKDEVLVIEPCYLAYPKLCALEGIAHRMVPLSSADGFRPRAEAVLEAVRDNTRLIVLNSPANPTGRIWSAEELEALARGLDSRGSSSFILADDVYRELHYGDAAPASPARWHQRTLIAGSLSKSNALTGLRLGWLIGPAEVIAGAVKVHQFVNTAASTFSQLVALELFREPERLASHRSWYLARRETLLSAAESAAIELIPPEGAFYALLRIPGPGADSLRIAETILDRERVVTVPGIGFGASAEGWLRISWAVQDASIQEGLRRIGRHFTKGEG